MKYVFPTILLVSLFCITEDVAATTQLCITDNLAIRVRQDEQTTVFEKIKNTLGLSSKPKRAKTPISPTQETSTKVDTPATAEKPKSPQEQKLAVVAAIKSMQEIINETTNRDDKAKFGMAAMVKAFREQAANNNNPQKNLFAQDLPIGEQLLAIQGNDLKQATALAEKLTPETQRLLKEAFEKRYSLFTRLGAFKEFANARQVTAA